jgi:hypothetical protein
MFVIPWTYVYFAPEVDVDIFFITVNGIALTEDIGIDPVAIMESGFTFLPRECLLSY